MFDLDAGDELGLVVDTARQLAETELAPRQRESEAARHVAAELRTTWNAVGLSDLEVPRTLGGAGFGSLARALVNEELAAGDAGAALALDAFGPALAALLEVGGEGAVAELLGALGEEGQRALLIGPGDATIEIGPDGVTLEAPWVPAERVGAAVVLAGDEALLVTERLALTPVRGAGLRAAGAARLSAVAAPVAGRWASPEGVVRARARARLYFASLLLGVLRAACEFAAGYSQQRVAFGKPIGHHQALAFLITDMRIALDAARLLVHEAAWRVDQRLPCAAEAAAAWAECIEASRLIGPGGVQVLGGHGFMADYPVEKHMREARALGLALGGYDAAVEEAGLLLSTCDAPLGLGVAGSL